MQIPSPRFDESRYAAIVAEHVAARPTVLRVDDAMVQAAYPALIAAAEAPVVDTASAASLLLAAEVHRAGYKVALAGEGSDEWLGGYPWHKAHKLMGLADVVPGVPVSMGIRRLLGRIAGATPEAMDRILSPRRTLGHYSAFHDLYSLMVAARYLLFAPSTLDALRDHDPYLELQPDLTRMRRWLPLHQSAYWAARIHLPGHLLSLKGDRVAMRSSVETRYPFLDEDVFAFLAGVHPRWKLRGLRDKYLLRLLAERYLPPSIAWRRKVMFRTPMASFFDASAPYVDQLLSEESLKRTGWFSVTAVRSWRDRIRRGDVRIPPAHDHRARHGGRRGVTALVSHVHRQFARRPSWGVRTDLGSTRIRRDAHHVMSADQSPGLTVRWYGEPGGSPATSRRCASPMA